MGEDRWQAYRGTFARHRVLFVVPVVVAVLAAGWVVKSSPKLYESSATLWVDNAAPTGSSLSGGSVDGSTPAQSEQTVLTELLSSSQFVSAVAKNGSLTSYLAAHHGVLPGDAGVSVSRIEAALGPHVTTTVAGAQVLKVTFAGPEPRVAQRTLTALIAQLRTAVKQFSGLYGQSAQGYYRDQYDAVSKQAGAARQQAQMYLSQHPGATALRSPTYSALLAAVESANSQVSQAQIAMSQAKTTSALNGPVLRLIDPSSIPTAATTGKKKIAEGVLAGLFAGLVISFLSILLITKRAETRTRHNTNNNDDADEDRAPDNGPLGPAMRVSSGAAVHALGVARSGQSPVDQ